MSKKKVATVCHFLTSKSLWLDASSNRFSEFAYLTRLLRPRNPIYAYLTTLLQHFWSADLVIFGSGGVWGASGEPLGSLGVVWGTLGRLWGAFGRLWGAKTARWGAFGEPSGRLWGTLGIFGQALERLSGDFAGGRKRERKHEREKKTKTLLPPTFSSSPIYIHIKFDKLPINRSCGPIL